MRTSTRLLIGLAEWVVVAVAWVLMMVIYMAAVR